MRQFSIRSKIILTLLLTGLSSLAAGGIIGYRSGAASLNDAVNRQLTAQRENKKQLVENYIRNQLRFTEAIGGYPEITLAAKSLIKAFRDQHSVVDADTAGRQADTKALETWYETEFLPKIDKIAGSHTPLEGLLPSDPVARRIQADYIARNPNPVGQKDKYLTAPGGSQYDVAHAQFHPAMKRIADAIGFYDINLMDAATGDVVYTVAKEVDFGSNMYHGPFLRSGFARAALRALDPKNGGKAVIEDYSAYMPSGFAPQMFATVPIIDAGSTIGVFVAQLDIRTLDNLLTDNKQWQATGQGETGEVQLLGEDRLLRSQSRFMATEPDKFLAQVKASGVPASVVEQMRALGTTILYMPDHNPGIERAFRNESGVDRFFGARGFEIIAAYGPLDVGGLRWVIQAKQDVSEAFAPEARLKRDLLVASGVATILITFLALACAGLFLRPLRRVIAGLQSLAGGAGVSGKGAVPIDARGDDEFADLAKSYNALAAEIGESSRKVAAAEQRADALMLSRYPARLAERLRSGADITAETVANVTVAVTWMDGVEALAASRSAPEMSDVLNTLLEALNAAAASHGVESVGSLGETHIAVCGLSSPRLDHAMRMLAWAKSATLAVQRLGMDWAESVTLRFGLASGEIDVLLLTRGHTPYDIWGRPLSVARRIVLEEKPGHARVSESTFALLTDVEGFRACPPIQNAVLGTLKTWSCAVAADGGVSEVPRQNPAAE
jgi:class 3 adenylate cyclase